MKTKKENKKLGINKVDIANLVPIEMESVQGGTDHGNGIPTRTPTCEGYTCDEVLCEKDGILDTGLTVVNP